ncbi:uncharacterized protein LOC144874053 [Branchiostoma floridae x Branchiostoma japonicum]
MAPSKAAVCVYMTIRVLGIVLFLCGCILIAVTLSVESCLLFCNHDRMPTGGISVLIAGVVAVILSAALQWCSEVQNKGGPTDVENVLVHYTRLSPEYNTDSKRPSLETDNAEGITGQSVKEETIITQAAIDEKLKKIPEWRLLLDNAAERDGKFLRGMNLTLSECRDKHFCGRDRPPYAGIAFLLLGVIAIVSGFVLLWCRGKKEHELQIEDKVEPKVHYTRASPGYNTESARQSVDTTPCNTPDFLSRVGTLDAKILCEKLDCVAMERACRNDGCSTEVDRPHLSLGPSEQQHTPLLSPPHPPNDMDSLRKIRQDYAVLDETARRLPRTPYMSSNVSKKLVVTASSSRRSSMTGSQRYCHSLVPYSGSSESLYSEEEDFSEQTTLLTRDSSKIKLSTAGIYTEENSRRGYFFFPAARKEPRRDTWGNRGTFKRTPAFYNHWEQSELSPQLVQLYSSAEDIPSSLQAKPQADRYNRAHEKPTQNNWLSRNTTWSTCTSYEQLDTLCDYETPINRTRSEQDCKCDDCSSRFSHSQTTVVENDGYSTDEEGSEFGDSEAEIRLASPARSITERPKTPFVGRAQHRWFFSSDEENVPSGKSTPDRGPPSNRNTNSYAHEDLQSGRNKMVTTKMTSGESYQNVDELFQRTRSNSKVSRSPSKRNSSAPVGLTNGRNKMVATKTTDGEGYQNVDELSQRARSYSMVSRSPSNRNTNRSSPADLTNGRNKMVATKTSGGEGYQNVDELSQRTRSYSMGTPMVSRSRRTEKPQMDRETTFASQRKRSRSLDPKQTKYDSMPAKSKQTRPREKPGSPNHLVRQSSMRVSSTEEHSNRGSMLNVQTDSKYLSVPAPVYPIKPKKSQRSEKGTQRSRDAKSQHNSIDTPTSTLRRTTGQLSSNRSLYSSCPDLSCSVLSLHNHTETASDKFGPDGGNEEKLSKFDKHLEDWCARYLNKDDTKKKQKDSSEDQAKKNTYPQVAKKRPPKDVVDGNDKRADIVDHRNIEQNQQPQQRKPPEHRKSLDVDKQKNSERSTRLSNPNSPSPQRRVKRSNNHPKNAGNGNGHTLKPNSIQREPSGGSTQRLYQLRRSGEESNGERSHRTHVHEKRSSRRSVRGLRNGNNHSKDKPRNKKGTSYDGDVDTSIDRRESLPKQNVGEHGKIRQAVERHRERAHHIRDKIDSTAHQMVDRHKERAHHIKDRIDSSAQHVVERHRERRHHMKDRIVSKRDHIKERVREHSSDGSKGRNKRSNSQRTNSSNSNKQKSNFVRRNTTGTTPALLSSRPGGLGRSGGGPSLMSRLAPSPLTILSASSSSLQLLQKTLTS